MKRLILTAVAVYVTGFLVSFLFHGLLLADAYKSVAHMMRSEAEMQSHILFISLGYAFWAFGFAWLYSKGVEAKPWLAQGLRFGLAIGAVWAAPLYLGMYASQPWPGDLIAMGLAADWFNAVVCGVVAAAINRGGATS